ncbi:galactitol-1-phosphate 5-dehydrogenase [Thermosediminibacter oceani]|uniref:Alcohol dehydrogenase GroES domain protein n=1 Tax=Thermosediminibacter oceani (strain ATCC BAA-1034 / DSM 16646 / JW/IW-1228P) TaxID=555079 RepID=D9RXX2_THEOJ|nr:galactitol-1-phosphate 5-dehydrogenase [Thermosediminibacter oceani]ADL08196.1 Alcohol dehydrogenase GroES domain protein [Thermosediminibacter oceani DSM 16646]
MKAGVLFGVNDIRYVDFPDPEYGEDDVIVEVKACGVCGSDPPRILKKWKYNLPAIPGHEISGVIVEKGPKVKNIEIGDRVAVVPFIPCGKCDNCLRGNFSLCDDYDMLGANLYGGFAEYVKVPSSNVLNIGDIDFEIAAMIEPLAVALHGVLGIRPTLGDTVAIMGSGILGQLVLLWLKICGVGDIIAVDISDKKLAEAKMLGATTCINAKEKDPVEEILKLTSNKGVDIAFECAGSTITQEQCLLITRKKGKIAYLGIAYSDIHLSEKAFESIFRKELTLKGFWNSYSAPFPGQEWYKSISYLKNKSINLESMITHRFELSKIKEAFDMIANKREEYNKIIIIP